MWESFFAELFFFAVVELEEAVSSEETVSSLETVLSEGVSEVAGTSYSPTNPPKTAL